MSHSGSIAGTITCQETGATKPLQHYLYPSEARMSSIVRVIHAELHEHKTDSAPFQIAVSALAMDSIGSVFDLALDFRVQSEEIARETIDDMFPGALHVVNGEFTCLEGGYWTLHNPEYDFVDEDKRKGLNRAFVENHEKQFTENRWLPEQHVGKLLHTAVTSTLKILVDLATDSENIEAVQQVFEASNGRLSFGKGRASGDDRAVVAAEAALASCAPEIHDYQTVTAMAVLCNVSCDVTVDEYEAAINKILGRFNEEILVTSTISTCESLVNRFEVTLLVGG